MAELFLAIQRSVAGFEKLIVIKRILPSMNQDRSFIEMLLQEARIAATLSHANIVQIFDVGQVDGSYFIAMEHVHGEDLRSIVRQMKKKGVQEFPLEHAITIVQGMCAGLAYAHEKRDLDGSALNIVHRDISPQNVVVTFTGDVKIVDFGIAKSDAKIVEETKSGRLKGKVPYMSPEQARGEHIDWRSDIFATGVMLFELTTGKRLFKGSSEYETLKLICEREYPYPSMVRAGYPADLELIVMRALAKDKAQRFQSCRDMQAALEEFARSSRIATSDITLSQFMQSLFGEKLEAQKEALLQGKQLADIIALQHDSGSGEIGDGSRPSSTTSTPAAAHTITNASAQRSSTASLVVALVALFVVLAGAGAGVFWYAKHKAQIGQATLASPLAEPQAAAPVARGSIEVASDPAGASIWINGDLRAEVTPATIAQLPLGSAIDVRLTKDGYEQSKETLTLSDVAPSGKVKMALHRGSVSVDVAAKPPNAIMLVDGKAVQGFEVDGLTSGVQHKIVLGAPGYAEQTLTFIGEPMEKKHFDVTLDKARDRKTRNSASSVTPLAGTVQPAGNGKLNVGATGGWCNIAVDGAARGATPVAGIELPAGAHKVTCTTADGKTQTATVTVAAEGTTRYKFTL
jgi:serine/threonine-protein kinase